MDGKPKRARKKPDKPATNQLFMQQLRAAGKYDEFYERLNAIRIEQGIARGAAYWVAMREYGFVPKRPHKTKVRPDVVPGEDGHGRPP